MYYFVNDVYFFIKPLIPFINTVGFFINNVYFFITTAGTFINKPKSFIIHVSNVEMRVQNKHMFSLTISYSHYNYITFSSNN